MKLEDQIIEELGTQMQSEIDFHILSDMLVELGWTRVIISRFQDNHHAIDIRIWCEEHIKNPYENRGTNFVFEDQGDAVNFTLRWI
jgi:hypothetical protein